MKLINENQIFETWAPMLKEELGVTDASKLRWLSKYAEFHSKSESSSKLYEGFTYPQASLLNTPGMGNVALGKVGGIQTFYDPTAIGSGDKFPTLLPLALQVAARTVGFDIVSVIPMPGPTGVLTYIDYVYAGGKDPYAPFTASNPGVYKEKPLMFKVKITGTFAPNVGDVFYFTANTIPGTGSVNAIKVKFVGFSRIDAQPIFKIEDEGSADNTPAFTSAGLHTLSLSDIFTSTVKLYKGDFTLVTTTNISQPSLVKVLEDHIQGFSGAGSNDTDDWNGPFVDGTKPYEPMRRGVGEERYFRTIGLQPFTKFVEAETYQVAATVTTEQIQDLAKQYGIDVVSMVENILVTELTQSINKHILSRAFALGWQNHKNANLVEAVNLNLNINSASSPSITSATFIGQDNSLVTIPVPQYTIFGASGATFENQDTLHSRILAQILAAGNLVTQRGRRGPATFIVTNLQVATVLQKNSQYSFAPVANTINQTNGTLYPAGTIAGMTVYVDPNMRWSDTRILVGRKGADEEPGLKYMPYLLAETIQTIAEGTMAPKVAVKSRYALVEAGFHPETQYVTLYVTNDGNSLLG